MQGFITEREFEEAEAEFPGIVQLFRGLEQKPKTFLDLFERYIHRDHRVHRPLVPPGAPRGATPRYRDALRAYR
jgi:hypothetical protein